MLSYSTDGLHSAILRIYFQFAYKVNGPDWYFLTGFMQNDKYNWGHRGKGSVPKLFITRVHCLTQGILIEFPIESQ